MRAFVGFVLIIGLVATARADELTIAQARLLGRASGDDRAEAIEILLRGAVTDHPRLRRAIRRSLVLLGGLSARAARRLPARRAMLRWLVAHDLQPPLVPGLVVTGEPKPGALRIALVPERCDDDFYTWAVVDVGPGGWTLVDSGVGNDC